MTWFDSYGKLSLTCRQEYISADEEEFFMAFDEDRVALRLISIFAFNLEKTIWDVEWKKRLEVDGLLVLIKFVLCGKNLTEYQKASVKVTAW